MVWKRKLIMISIWQSSISFIRKKSQQARNRRELSQPDIGICEKPTANIVLTSGRLNAFSLKPGKKRGISSLTISIQITLEILAIAAKLEREGKVLRLQRSKNWLLLQITWSPMQKMWWNLPKRAIKWL